MNTIYHSFTSQFFCVYCYAVFPNQALLETHDATSCPNRFQCKVASCGVRLENRKQYYLHLLEAHQQNHLFKCGKCQKTFSKPSALKPHIAQTCSDGVLTCRFCHRGFHSKALLEVHERIKHRFCHVCGEISSEILKYARCKKCAPLPIPICPKSLGRPIRPKADPGGHAAEPRTYPSGSTFSKIPTEGLGQPILFKHTATYRSPVPSAAPFMAFGAGGVMNPAAQLIRDYYKQLCSKPCGNVTCAYCHRTFYTYLVKHPYCVYCKAMNTLPGFD